jgi:hypothetical protein
MSLFTIRADVDKIDGVRESAGIVSTNSLQYDEDTRICDLKIRLRFSETRTNPSCGRRSRDNLIRPTDVTPSLSQGHEGAEGRRSEGRRSGGRARV